MKPQKKTLIVFLLLISLIIVSIAPVNSASGDNGMQNIYGQGNYSGTQQQGSPDVTNPMWGPGGQQGEGHNQNGSGQQGGHDQNSSAGGGQYRHRYQNRFTIIDGASNYTRLRSQCRNNAIQEAFEIYFTIDNTPTLELTYIPTLNASVGQRHFSLIIEQLIEFNDINANGKYDHNDIVRSSLLMSNVTFTNITYTNRTTSDGKTFTFVETHTPDGLFAIVLYLVSERITVSNTTLTQKEIKIDFRINNYPFVNQSSQLALVTQVETLFMVTPEQNTYNEKQGTATQESGLNISSVNRSGFFTWANEAIVDNIIHPVNVTVISETEQTFTGDDTETFTQTQVIFSYPRGERIIHDPKIGVIEYLGGILPSVLQSEYFFLIYLFACLTSGIVFYGIVYYRKKR